MIQSSKHKRLSDMIGIMVSVPAGVGAFFWEPKILPWLAGIGMCVGIGVWLAVMMVTSITAFIQPERHILHGKDFVGKVAHDLSKGTVLQICSMVLLLFWGIPVPPAVFMLLVGLWAFGLASALTSIHFMWGVCLAHLLQAQRSE